MNQINYLLQHPESIDRLCCIFFFGRSGSHLLGSALDGHPEVLMLPPNTIEYFALDPAFMNQRSFDGIEDLISVTLSNFPGVVSSLDTNRGERFLAHLRTTLESVLRRKVTPSWRVLFFAVHVAYAAALDRHIRSKHPVVVWNAHILTPVLGQAISKFFPEAKSILCVRYPSKTIDSHFHHYYRNPEFDPPDSMPYWSLHFCFSVLRYLPGGPAAAVRFEDMHSQTEDTMRAVAEWLGIQWDPVLLTTTWNGEIMWAAAGSGDMITGFSPERGSDRRLKHVSRLDAVRMRRIFDAEFRTWSYLPANPSWPALLNIPWRIQWQILRDTIAKNVSTGISAFQRTSADFIRALGRFSRAVVVDVRQLGEPLAKIPRVSTEKRDGAENVVVIVPGFYPLARILLKAMSRRPEVISLPWSVSNALFDRLARVSLDKADSLETLTTRLAAVMGADPKDPTGPVVAAIRRAITECLEAGNALSIATMVRCMAMAHATVTGKPNKGVASTLVLVNDRAEIAFPEARFITCTAEEPLTMIWALCRRARGRGDPISEPSQAAEIIGSRLAHPSAATVSAEDLVRRPDAVAGDLGIGRFTQAEIAVLRRILAAAPKGPRALMIRVAWSHVKRSFRDLVAGFKVGTLSILLEPVRLTVRLRTETARIATMIRYHTAFRAKGNQPPPLLGPGGPL